MYSMFEQFRDAGQLVYQVLGDLVGIPVIILAFILILAVLLNSCDRR